MLDDVKIGILSNGPQHDKLMSYAAQIHANISFMHSHNIYSHSQHTQHIYSGNCMSYQDVFAFGQSLDIISVKCDEADIQALYDLKARGVKIFPFPETIEIIQNKSILKQVLKENHIPISTHWLVIDRESLSTQTDKISIQANKTLEGNLHQAVLKIQTTENVYPALHKNSAIEDMVDIIQEISVIVARNESGMIECYHPIVMTYDQERLLVDFELFHSVITKDIGVKIGTIAIQVAEAVNLTGMITVDMIIASNGKIYVDDVSLKTPCNKIQTTNHIHCTPIEHQIRKILELPLLHRKEFSYSSMHSMIEPTAYRKHSIEEALKTILCTNDMHLYWNDKETKRESPQKRPLPFSDTQREELLSKAILINHILIDNHA